MNFIIASQKVTNHNIDLFNCIYSTFQGSSSFAPQILSHCLIRSGDSAFDAWKLLSLPRHTRVHTPH